MSQRLVTVQEAADLLGLSPYTLYAWIAQRRIVHTRLGRAVRIPAAEVRRLIREGTVRVERKEGSQPAVGDAV
jgi:excisionase family DNA binding protein